MRSTGYASPFKQDALAVIGWFTIHPEEKKKRYIIPQFLANQTSSRSAVVPIPTALLSSSLNDLKFFFVFLYTF